MILCGRHCEDISIATLKSKQNFYFYVTPNSPTKDAEIVSVGARTGPHA